MKIAVIGTGITGLGAAWSLEQGILAHEGQVILYEADNRLGGHSNTVDVTLKNPDGSTWHRPVDTGFIVFNSYNYPNLVKLFEHFDVPTTVTDMEFGVSVGKGRGPWNHKQKLEYRANNLFAQRRNLTNPPYIRMVLEILKFFKLGRLAQLEGIDEQLTLGDFLDRHGFSRVFANEFLLPMAAAIWSGTSLSMRDYPVATFLRFYRNHGLLALNESPIWHTVDGGSRVYVEKLKAALRAEIRMNTPVTRVQTLDNDQGVVVTDHSGHQESFDQVIFACHSDQALTILGDDASARERELLGAIEYKPNRAVLHTDANQLPNRRSAWSSWNYLAEDSSAECLETAISYYMNDLQVFESPEPVVVTVNPFADIDESKILQEFSYAHPQFNMAAINAQRHIHEIQGVRNRWFAGAWTGYGFHEDGLQSGLTVAAALGGTVPWAGNIMPMSPSSQCVNFGDVARRIRQDLAPLNAWPVLNAAE